jgi:hypothetical protein
MEKRVKVVLFGDTLVLAGLQASLATYTGLEVLWFEASVAGERQLCALRPDVVIVDAATSHCLPLHLPSDLPSDLLLVSVDAATNRVLVWSGEQLSASSTGDLVALIGRRGPQHLCDEPIPDT